MSRLALIDGDIIAYRAAAACQRDTGWSDDAPPEFAEADVRRKVEQTVEEWVRGAGCTDHMVLLTGKGNFRKVVSPTYKANRKDAPRPLGLSYAREVLTKDFGAVWVDGLEADDLIGLSLTGSKAGAVAVSIDKDLRTIPGTHFNPMKDKFPVEVDERAADLLWLTQTITGDQVDGYPGAPGAGPAAAKKALKDGPSWAAVLEVFASRGKSIDEAITQARLARILRSGEYDKTTKEVLLWHPETPIRLPLV